MLRSRRFASFASPFIAASLLLPSVALASPYARSVPVLGMQAPAGESLAQPIPGQTPARVEQPVVAPGSQTQLTVAGSQQGQSTLHIPPTPPGGTTIIVQPQIQIGGNVAPSSSADSNVNTNTTSTATPQVTTNTTSTATPQVTTNTSTSTAPVAAAPPVYAPPPQQRYPQQRYSPPPAPPRVVTRVVSRPTGAPAPAPAYRTPPSPRKGLMVTGWILFSVSYLITASNAADLYDRCPHMRNPQGCRDLSENMFIPVVGPFLAMEQARFATDDFSLAVSGSLQGLGLIMGIVGTVQHHRDRYRNRILSEYGVRVGKNTALNAGSRVGGGQLTLTARF